MDLTEPITALVPAGTASLLRVLTSTDEMFSVRQLARVAGVSHPVAATAVERLRQHGLVRVDRIGPSYACRFNSDHLAAAAVRTLVDLRGALVERLRGLVVEWDVPASHVSLFGSAARGTGDVDSDVDLLVVWPEPEEDLLVPTAAGQVEPRSVHHQERLHATASTIERATGNQVNWVQLDQRELRAMAAAREPVVETWLREAVLLAGASLDEVLRSPSSQVHA